MTCDDSCKSVLSKIFSSMNSGVFWTSTQFKSACPPKKKKIQDEDVKSSDEEKDCPPTKKAPPENPSEICPTVKPCCYIKMQDPCRPCCCDTKPKPPPCPPRCTPQEPREPVCGCDLCQKNPNNPKCCDKSRTYRDITIDRQYFDKA